MNTLSLKLFPVHFQAKVSRPPGRGASHKSIKGRSEMLRQAQHDNKGPFCHSEEQSDEESRVMQRSPWQGRKIARACKAEITIS